jgi:hypothetical protein
MVVINRGREAYCKGHALGTKLADLKPDDTDREGRFKSVIAQRFLLVAGAAAPARSARNDYDAFGALGRRLDYTPSDPADNTCFRTTTCDREEYHRA